MKFASWCIGTLFLVGVLGLTLISTSDNGTLFGVPGALILTSFSTLAWANAFAWLKKSSDNWVRVGGACFITAVIGIPLLNPLWSGDFGPTGGSPIDPQLLVSIAKWLMDGSTLCSLVSIRLSHKRINGTTD